MIKKHRTSGKTVYLYELDSVNSLIESDKQWAKENDFECNMIVKVISDNLISLYYRHDSQDNSDTSWVILRSELTEQEWIELLEYYNDFLDE